MNVVLVVCVVALTFTLWAQPTNAARVVTLGSRAHAHALRSSGANVRFIGRGVAVVYDQAQTQTSLNEIEIENAFGAARHPIVSSDAPVLVVKAWTRSAAEAVHASRFDIRRDHDAVSVARAGPRRLSIRLRRGANATAVAARLARAFESNVEYVAAAPVFKKHVVEQMALAFVGGEAEEAVVAASLSSSSPSIVALADTGIDTRHCAFYDGAHAVPTALLRTIALASSSVPDTAHASIRAYVSVCTDATCSVQTGYADVKDGHGTGMASVVAMRPCVGSGDRGLLPSSRVAFFDLSAAPDGATLDLPVHLSDMFSTAKALGARVMSLSWGAGCDSTYDDAAAQIDDWLVSNPDFVVVVSAGNCGENAGLKGVASPAIAKNVLSVAALFDSARVASFSSIGYASDGRMVPLVAAPGVNVRVADAAPNDPATPHAGEQTVSGTSPAAPFLASVAELVRLALAAHNVTSSAAVRAAIVATAAPIDAVAPYGSSSSALDATGAHHRAAFGALNATAALGALVVVEGVLDDAQAESFCFSVPADAVDVSIGLAWTDPAASPSANVSLVNALGLLVSTLTPSTDYVVADDVNNHKRVRFSTTGGGLFSASVSAEFVSAPQAFSLVVAVRAGSGGASLVALGACVAQGLTRNATWVAPRAPPCLLVGGGGTGLVARDASGAHCAASSCDSNTGHVFASSGPAACVASGDALAFVPATATCPEGHVWTGAACACAQPLYVCADDVTIVDCASGQECTSSERAATRSPTYAWQADLSDASARSEPILLPPPLEVFDASASFPALTIVAGVMIAIMVLLSLACGDQFRRRIPRSATSWWWFWAMFVAVFVTAELTLIFVIVAAGNAYVFFAGLAWFVCVAWFAVVASTVVLDDLYVRAQEHARRTAERLALASQTSQTPARPAAKQRLLAATPDGATPTPTPASTPTPAKTESASASAVRVRVNWFGLTPTQERFFVALQAFVVLHGVPILVIVALSLSVDVGVVVLCGALVYVILLAGFVVLQKNSSALVLIVGVVALCIGLVALAVSASQTAVNATAIVVSSIFVVIGLILLLFFYWA